MTLSTLFKRPLFYCILFALQITTSQAQVSTSDIDAIVTRAMDSFAVAGAAIAVVKDGKIIHEKGYGLTSITGKTLVNQHTNFGIASNTKAFTTTALALLVEDGKLSWTDKVIQYIPEFTMYNDYVKNNFTIQDLLTHRSGLGLGVGDLMFFPDGSDFTVADIINSFQYFKPVSAFRTQWDYDNLLYIVAGEVIARVSGMPYETFIASRIFKPLGMDNSYTNLADIPAKSNTAKPHLNNGKTISLTQPEIWDPKKINGAAGSIYSNVHDLSQWMLVHLNHGAYGPHLNQHLFSTSSQDDMWTIHTTKKANTNPRYNSHFAGYGLGWELTDVKGNMMVSHTGGLMGMLSKTVLIPDQNLGIVVLTNTYLDGAGLFMAVTQTLIDRYLELDDFDWTATYAQALKAKSNEAETVVNNIMKTAETADKSKVNFNDYTGQYQDPWFGTIEIYTDNDKLWFKALRSPKLKGEMLYYKANTFVCTWSDASLVDADAFVIFGLNEEGIAQKIHMKGISPAIDFSYDFQDLNFTRVSSH